MNIPRSTIASLVSTVFVFASVVSLQAKRGPPPFVKPVTIGSVRYSVSAQPQLMGFVIAAEVATGKELWRQRIYRVRMNPLREEDVQWVFITSLIRRDRKLLVTNESDEHFTLDLTTRKVTKRE
jgi:hypothetical protein